MAETNRDYRIGISIKKMAIMKKRYFIGGTLAVALCVIVLYAFAANESADVPDAAATGQQTVTTVSRSGG